MARLSSRYYDIYFASGNIFGVARVYKEGKAQYVVDCGVRYDVVPYKDGYKVVK